MVLNILMPVTAQLKLVGDCQEKSQQEFKLIRYIIHDLSTWEGTIFFQVDVRVISIIFIEAVYTRTVFY